MDDIKRAQKLSFSMTNILSSAEAHRAIRIIYRGEYHKIAQAAEDHGLRKYLVATDLSDESTHALEWAVGTVLRDGDTLIAIYCVDEETGIVTSEGALVPDDPKAMKEQAAVINSVTNTKLALAPTTAAAEFRRPSAFNFLGEAISTPGSSPAPTGRDHRGRASEERRRAVQGITDRVLRLLRKTNLQVRVVVEVLHCKNPKHLITEVIDLVNPTLVVIGSRGRSALKGYVFHPHHGRTLNFCGMRLTAETGSSWDHFPTTWSLRARSRSWWRGSDCGKQASIRERPCGR